MEERLVEGGRGRGGEGWGRSWGGKGRGEEREGEGGGVCSVILAVWAQEVVVGVTAEGQQQQQHSPHSPCIILLASFPRLTSPRTGKERETVRGKTCYIISLMLEDEGISATLKGEE